MRLILPTFIFIWCSFANAQHKYTALKTIHPDSSDFSDLQQLDSIWSSKIIIGIGESSHGTSEFTTMRHRIFKYLVMHHGYNTFFLEGDYGACKTLDRYIKGEYDSILPAIKKIKLWPWMTEEMKTLVEWMKEYNQENNNVLSFVGCDMQFINDDIEELKRIFPEAKKINALLDSMMETSFLQYKNDTTFRRKNSKNWETALLEIKNQPVSPEHLTPLALLINGVDQFFLEFKDKRIYSNHRDSCMGTNLFTYTKYYPKTKGVYFAHNGHLQKWRSDKGKLGVWRSAGQFAFELMGNNYYSILQEFYDGSVLAVNLKKRELESFRSISDKKNHLGYYLNEFNQSILFMESSEIPGLEKMCMRTIGAVFESSRAARKQKRYYGKMNKEMFDAVLFIQTSTPTTYLFPKK